jgi:uncharacterized alpha-E superfamily protein
VLCRVADSLYWVGRYLERAEHRARLLEVHLELMLYQTPEDVGASWRRLAEILQVDLTDYGADEIDPLAIAQAATRDSRTTDSIAYCIQRARENARQVREVISSEMWAQINHVYLRMPMPGDDSSRVVSAAFYQSLRRQLHLFEGITDATFLHGEGWRFLRLGRYIERAIATARLLGGYLDSLEYDEQADASDVTWIGLLQSCTAVEAYTRRYTADPRPRNIAEFLLLSPEFPHSLRFSVEQACQVLEGLEGLPRPAGRAAATALSRGAGRLRAQLEFVAVDEILSGAPGDYLADIRAQCMRIHDLVHDQYIAYPLELASVFTTAGGA